MAGSAHFATAASSAASSRTHTQSTSTTARSLFTYRSMAACSHSSVVLPTDTTLTRRPRLICSGATRDACVGLCARCGANISATTTSEARSRRWTMAERIVPSLPRLHQSITRSSLFTRTDSSLFNADNPQTKVQLHFHFPKMTPPGTTDCCAARATDELYTRWLAHALVRFDFKSRGRLLSDKVYLQLFMREKIITSVIVSHSRLVVWPHTQESDRNHSLSK